MPALGKDAQYLSSLVTSDRPARMVGLFTSHSLKPRDIERLVDACLGAMREEDAGAALTLAPLGNPSPRELDLQRSWRVSVVEHAGAAPHDCLVQVFAMGDPESPHRALLDHIGGMDRELSEAASSLQQSAQTYLSIASGKLDDGKRVHAFQNLVSLFTSALGAAIVDPAGAIVSTDPGEWADAMEMSLQLEKDMGTLRK
ncbi:MAG: hypothetical protein E6J78_06815 [Deltaproteobacteria bacterium]|nr:MAG: hypothetical protein E6J78_06815 [Deltaproteobacteria bacterium]